MNEVFISYKTDDFDEALWVKTTLEANGISCWMAPMGIPGGSDYATEIPRAIRACTAFVLVFSRFTQDSKWVPKEVDQAINEDKVLLPFILDDVPLRDNFRFYLSNVQMYRAYKSKSAAMEEMLKRIKGILDTDDISEEKLMAQVGEVEEESGAEINAQTEVAAETPQAEIAVVPAAELTAVDVVTEVIEAEKAEDKKSKRKNKADKKPGGKKGKGNIKAIAIGAAAVVALVCLAFVGLNFMNTVEIAGEKYNVNENAYISVRDYELTEKDLSNILKLKELRRVSFENCTFPAGYDLNRVLERAVYEVGLISCGVTDEMFKAFNFSDWAAEKLVFNDNPGLTSIARLAPLKSSLLSLQVDNCGISDISLLGEFEELQSIHASGNRITDISALSNCKELLSVELSDNEITELFEVPEGSKITHIELNNNKLTNLDALELALKLQNLKVAGNNILNINGIRNATLLVDVDLSDNKIGDIALLAKSAATLKKLDISNNLIEGIAAVADCVKLETLYANNNKLTSIYGIGKQTELKEFSAEGNKIVSITELEKCTKLSYVDVSDNEIISMAPLANMEKNDSLRIDVSNNKITKLVLPRVASDRFITKLDIHGNTFTSLETEFKIEGSTIALDYNEKIDFAAFNENNEFYNYYFFNCPLDKLESVRNACGYHTVKFVTEEEYVSIMAE